jgi:hypothetical protein
MTRGKVKIPSAAMPCPNRRLSDVLQRQLIADAWRIKCEHDEAARTHIAVMARSPDRGTVRRRGGVCRSGELGPCHQLWLRADSRQIVDCAGPTWPRSAAAVNPPQYGPFVEITNDIRALDQLQPPVGTLPPPLMPTMSFRVRRRAVPVD